MIMIRTNYSIHLNAQGNHSLRRLINVSVNDWRVSAFTLLIGSAFLIIISSLAHADDSELPVKYDAKDITMVSGPAVPTGQLFLPMPNWSKSPALATTPWQLTPNGTRPAVVAAATHAPMSPPKEPMTTPVTEQAKEVVAKPAPAPEPPALMAVSPFLQWVKSNPKAADDARTQAAANAPAPTVPATANTIVAGPNGASNSQDPYWLPPMIDSSNFGSGPVTGSAAIYSTPQR